MRRWWPPLWAPKRLVLLPAAASKKPAPVKMLLINCPAAHVCRNHAAAQQVAVLSWPSAPRRPLPRRRLPPRRQTIAMCSSCADR